AVDERFGKSGLPADDLLEVACGVGDGQTVAQRGDDAAAVAQDAAVHHDLLLEPLRKRRGGRLLVAREDPFIADDDEIAENEVDALAVERFRAADFLQAVARGEKEAAALGEDTAKGRLRAVVEEKRDALPVPPQEDARREEEQRLAVGDDVLELAERLALE